jgi:hypothetical protein
MEYLIVGYLVLAAIFGLFVSAMTQQTGPIAMSFFIMLSIIALPVLIVYAIVQYALEHRL